MAMERKLHEWSSMDPSEASFEWCLALTSALQREQRRAFNADKRRGGQAGSSISITSHQPTLRPVEFFAIREGGHRGEAHRALEGREGTARIRGFALAPCAAIASKSGRCWLTAPKA